MTAACCAGFPVVSQTSHKLPQLLPSVSEILFLLLSSLPQSALLTPQDLAVKHFPIYTWLIKGVSHLRCWGKASLCCLLCSPRSLR